MKFSLLTLGLMVVGMSSLTIQGCADVALPELLGPECVTDEDGYLRCSVLSAEDSDYEEHVREPVDPAAYLDAVYENDLDTDFYFALGGSGLPPSNHDTGTFSVDPLFPRPEAEGPCPDTKVDEEGQERCLDDIIIIELPNDRAVYECVYGEC